MKFTCLCIEVTVGSTHTTAKMEKLEHSSNSVTAKWGGGMRLCLRPTETGPVNRMKQRSNERVFLVKRDADNFLRRA